MRGIPGFSLSLVISILHPKSAWSLRTDFWNLSKYSCAAVFSFVATLLCIVASAAKIGPMFSTSLALDAMLVVVNVYDQSRWGGFGRIAAVMPCAACTCAIIRRVDNGGKCESSIQIDQGYGRSLVNNVRMSRKLME